MTDDELDAQVDRIITMPEEDQVMTICALVESLPAERQQMLQLLMRAMLKPN